MGKSAKARALYDALRTLEEKAKNSHSRKNGKVLSRRDVAQQAGGGKSLSNRLGEWLHEDWDRARTPDSGSEIQLMAVVRVWSKWAQEGFDERRWATLLEEAQAPRVPQQPEPKRESVFGGYSAWIEQNILPARLVGRQEELRELTAFCSAPDRPAASAYVWWQAGPWAGKSALVSEFVLRHRPATVEIVSYFITDRLGRNDREGFLDTVGRQLVFLAGRDGGAVSVRAEDFPDLCQAAAAACRSRGSRLLLVVDGLDEDQGTAAGERSLASLLPRHPPAGMRVVITGRPGPPIPDDVPPDHPLRTLEIIRALTPYPDAQGISTLARRELHRLLTNEKVGIPLLGLLVAARGGLTAADLAGLVGVLPYQVDEMLRGITGRSFLPADHGQIRLPEAPAQHSHALGHEELRRESLAALGGVTRFEEQLHAWADVYQARGWPPGSPDYLLYDYPRMLHSTGDTERLTAIALDPRRQQALLARASLDAALSEIETSAQMIRRQCPDDLVGLAGLAASRTMLNERARAVPASLPVALARLGHPQRAMQFALAAPHPALKAIYLAKVAQVLAEAGDQHAVQAARETAQWAERARAESAPPSGDEDDVEVAIAEAAVALIAVGDHRQGRELLSSLRSPAWHGNVTLRCVSTAQAALAARRHAPGLAEELLEQAERNADEVAFGSPADPSTPVTAWAAIAEAADSPRADLLRERIVRYTEGFPSCLLSCLVDAAAASALATDRPEQAQALAQQAARRLQAALHDPEALPDDDASNLAFLLHPILTGVTRALVDTGGKADARHLITLVPDAKRTFMGIDAIAGANAVIAEDPGSTDKAPSAEILAAQACRLTEQGRPKEANHRLHQALELLAFSPPAPLPYETWLITLCTALAAIGRHADATQLARSLRATVMRRPPSFVVNSSIL